VDSLSGFSKSKNLWLINSGLSGDWENWNSRVDSLPVNLDFIQTPTKWQSVAFSGYRLRPIRFLSVLGGAPTSRFFGQDHTSQAKTEESSGYIGWMSSYQSKCEREESALGCLSQRTGRQGISDLVLSPEQMKKFSANIDAYVSKADQNWLKISPRTYNTETRSFESPWPFGPEGGAQ
jgi:hypothetical protein